MFHKSRSVLVIGFNTRPLALSLFKAKYDVYAVDFFGDLDLYPLVKDSIIITEELNTNYDLIKEQYHHYLTEFAIKISDKYPKINYLIIGSGLDDAFNDRNFMLQEIRKKNKKILSINNELKVLMRARDIKEVFKILVENEYEVPETKYPTSIDDIKNYEHFPLILKKFRSSGGMNVYKIENRDALEFTLKRLESKMINISDWLTQEYLDGIPVSCTIISDGIHCKVISINRQIIGEKYLNAPKDFTYCGNVVPAQINPNVEKVIKKISLMLSKKLKLRGINGFDFVIRDQFPYLMEINPRIPGSIRASELALNVNLLDLHVRSFDDKNWKEIEDILSNSTFVQFVTKLIVFSPQKLNKSCLIQINNLRFVHDKTNPNTSVQKYDPLCTILFGAQEFSSSYFGALKIVDKIYKLISE
ncbi:MAG: ATP-grasp domain-containing protein [Promethearchaeota archaeon]